MVIYSYILITTIIAVLSTRYFIKHQNWTSVRASAFTSVSFILIMMPFEFQYEFLLENVFLGASFIGMSHPDKFRKRELGGISFIFSLLYYFWTMNFKGVGGALGATAFTSCLTLVILRKGHSFTRNTLSRQNK